MTSTQYKQNWCEFYVSTAWHSIFILLKKELETKISNTWTKLAHFNVLKLCITGWQALAGLIWQRYIIQFARTTATQFLPHYHGHLWKFFDILCLCI